MSLIRWNPLHELDRWPSDFVGVQRDINRLFDNFFHSGSQTEETMATSYFAPAVDIAEQENEYVVKIELPGVAKDDVKISVESNTLTIKGEKKQENEQKSKNFHRVERSYGSFQRSFTLPSTVKNDKIDAVFNSGILTITMPKSEEAKPKLIEVKVR